MCKAVHCGGISIARRRHSAWRFPVARIPKWGLQDCSRRRNGWLMRLHGATCDNLLDAQVITADGRSLRANSQSTRAASPLWPLRRATPGPWIARKPRLRPCEDGARSSRISCEAWPTLSCSRCSTRLVPPVVAARCAQISWRRCRMTHRHSCGAVQDNALNALCRDCRALPWRDYSYNFRHDRISATRQPLSFGNSGLLGSC